MKLLTLLVLTVAVTGWESNREYTYKYESQVVTGVPHHAVQIAGVKIAADVRIQVKTGNRVTLKLEDVKIYKIQTSLEQAWPESGLLPDSVLSKVDKNVEDEMMKELTKPIKFIYTDGTIDKESLKMDPNEALWSVNIKKGVISNLKVNAKEESEIDIEEHFDEGWKNVPEKYKQHMMKSKVYAVMETDITGECESLYAINKVKTEDQENREDESTTGTMKVTKVRNYDKCVKAPVFEQGFISGLTISPEIMETKDIIEKSSHTDYEIKGTTGSFIIKKVRQDSRYILTPETQVEGSAVTSIIQMMTLMKEKPMDAAIIPEMQLRVREKGLLYEFPVDILARREPEEQNRGGMSAQDIITNINRLVDETIPKVTPIVRDECIDNIKVIGSLLKRLSVENMVKLCEKYISEGEGKPELTKKTELILDMIPTLTSPKSLPVIARLITTKKISTTRAVISLKVISLMITPDIKLMEFMSPTNDEYMNNPVIKENKAILHTVFLTTGTIWMRMFRATQNAGISTKELLAVTHAYRNVEHVMNWFKQSDRASKLAFIKGFGNSGYPGFIPLLTGVIADKTEDISVRKSALYGFRRMSHHTKQKVQSILTSVYMDHSEVPHMRMTAFVALMDTRPGPAILNIISRVQRREKSVQVGSFVYSYLSTMATADLPGLLELGFNIRRIMPLIRPINPYTVTGSKAVHLDYLCKYANMGAGLELFKLDHGKSMIPSTVVIRTMLHTMGKTMDVIEAGVYTKGIDHILSKLIGVHSNLLTEMGEKTLKEIIEAILVPLNSGKVDLGEMSEEIKSVIEKLGIVERPVLEKLNIGFFLSLFGNDITLLDITADDVLTWIQTGKIPILGDVKDLIQTLTTGAKAMDMLKVINLGTSTLQIPTPAGIPISFNFTGTAAINIKGQVTTQPSSIMNIMTPRRTGEASTEVGVQTSLGASSNHAWVVAMGVDVGLLKTGVALKGTLQTILPIKVDIKANTKTWKLTTSLELPQKEVKTLNARIKPMVFVTEIDPTEAVQNRKLTAIPLTHPSRVEIVDATIPVSMPALNTKLTMKYLTPVTLPKWMPISLLWAESMMEFTLTPITTGTSYTIELEVDVTKENIKEVLPAEIKVNPAITEPQCLKVAVKAGPKSGSETNKAVITLITSKDMMTTQINVLLKAPESLPSPMMTEMFLKLDALSPRKLKHMGTSTTVCEIKFVAGTKTMTIKAFPAGSEKMTWNKYQKNNFFKLLNLFTKEKITSTVLHPVTEKPPTLEYKLKVESDVHFEEVSQIAKTLATVMSTAMYMQLEFPNIPVSYIEKISSPPASVEGQLKITPMFQKVDIVMRYPKSMEYSLELPGYLWRPWYKMLTLESPILNLHSVDISEDTPVHVHDDGHLLDKMSGKCSVTEADNDAKSIVNTFDRLGYDLPSLPNTCEVVLSKDCSELHLFTVLMKPVQETKVLKVLIPEHKIEIAPLTARRSSTVVCKVTVDDKEMTLQEGTNHPITETKEPGRDSQFGTITKSAEWVTIHLSTVGLTISTDGKQVFLKTSPFMRSHLCGLCGNFNDEPMDDVEGPDMSLSRNEKEMISEYIVPSKSCTPESVRTHLGIEVTPTKTCTPTERTIVRDRDEETCFSINPLRTCPPGCHLKTIERATTIPFHCKNTNSHEARAYIEDSKHGIVEELKQESVSARIRVDIPRDCSLKK